mgnify:CR=1 FL=1|jgi:hypothetical protein|tara:strand:- start:11057 stop:11341 length:285 start_codon:yes stop_codon:yes gene_type:complete
MDFDSSYIDTMTKDLSQREALEICIDITHHNFSENFTVDEGDIPSALLYFHTLIDKIEEKRQGLSSIDPVIHESIAALFYLRSMVIKLSGIEPY